MKLPIIVIVGMLLAVACAPAKPAKKTIDPTVHTTLGVSYLKEGNSTKALKEFLLAVDGDPDNPEIHAGLAQAYYMKRAYPLAEEHYLKALEFSDGDPQYRNNLGALYLEMKNWDEAIVQFRTAADNLLFDSPEVALTGLGVAQSRKGNYVDAIESYKLALRVNPKFPQAHLHVGQAYYALNKLVFAVDSYQSALQLYPNYLEAHYRLGLAYMRQKNSALAREEFEKVLSIAPGSEQGRLAKDYLTLLD